MDTPEAEDNTYKLRERPQNIKYYGYHRWMVPYMNPFFQPLLITMKPSHINLHLFLQDNTSRVIHLEHRHDLNGD